MWGLIAVAEKARRRLESAGVETPGGGPRRMMEVGTVLCVRLSSRGSAERERGVVAKPLGLATRLSEGGR